MRSNRWQIGLAALVLGGIGFGAGMLSRWRGPQDRQMAQLRSELARVGEQAAALEKRLAGLAKPEEPAKREPSFQGKTLSHWMLALQDSDPEYVRSAADAIAQIGPQARAAIPVLIQVYLGQARQSQRKPLREALRYVDDRHELLRARLRDREYPVRRDAALVLSFLGLKDDEERLQDGPLPRMPEPDEPIRRPEDREAIPVLIETLKDNRPSPLTEGEEVYSYQDLALACLASFGAETSEAVPILRQMLADRNPAVRDRVTRVLGKIGPAAKSAVPALLAGLKDPEHRVRVACAVALGGIGPEARAAAPLLMAGLKDRDNEIRASSAAALGGLGDAASEAIPALKEALKDKEAEVRVGAAEGLGGMKSAATTVVGDLLEAVTKDIDTRVQHAAVTALGCLGPKAKVAVPTLVKIATDRETYLYVEAINALRQIAPEEADKLSSDRLSFPSALPPPTFQK